jgi:N4-(beta-N-acetylglucosaminyl)-L-asparaginase
MIKENFSNYYLYLVMLSRRKFLQSSFLTSSSIFISKYSFSKSSSKGPVVLSTWSPNVKANAAAWTLLENKGRALDAVEKGVRITEADPSDQSVGYGGLPDRDGKVTLDACIMDEKGNCGAVMALENIMHPVSVARLVMEKTPHVQLTGAGALKFALSQGFKKENLLTAESEKAWREWLKTSQYDPMKTVDNIEEEMNKQKQKEVKGQVNNHDTIGMIALDSEGNLSGACSTSGMAYKMSGRVGDSPIIGAGLFIDNEVGAATSTGVGEEVIKVCGSHTVVELMRQGFSPQEACKKAVERIVKRNGLNAKTIQVAFIALNKNGEYGGYSALKGFNYGVKNMQGEKVYDSKSIF